MRYSTITGPTDALISIAPNGSGLQHRRHRIERNGRPASLKGAYGSANSRRANPVCRNWSADLLVLWSCGPEFKESLPNPLREYEAHPRTKLRTISAIFPIHIVSEDPGAGEAPPGLHRENGAARLPQHSGGSCCQFRQHMLVNRWNLKDSSSSNLQAGMVDSTIIHMEIACNLTQRLAFTPPIRNFCFARSKESKEMVITFLTSVFGRTCTGVGRNQWIVHTQRV